MEREQIERLLTAADDFRRRRNWPQAIETCRRILAEDPEHARAHASLALALIGARRLEGARIEIGLALAHDGNDAFCHHAAAVVRRAERKLDDAWQHCLVAIEHDEDVPALVLGASIQLLRGLHDEASELVERALERAPGDAGALRMQARLLLAVGDLDAAARSIETSLRAEPDVIESHVIAGHVALARGAIDDADRHVQVALHASADDVDAIGLLCAIKARRSRLLGLWWRWSSWVARRGAGGQIGLQIGSFLLARLAMILAGAVGLDELAGVIQVAWLGFCAYTWIAPVMLRKMIARELETVKLRDDY
jgi:tetratricopeptide (TPR) repeat protein